MGENHERLSAQEWEVLRLLARGLANKQIACELRLSINTVKEHVSTVYRKLSVPNRVVATARYWEVLAEGGVPSDRAPGDSASEIADGVINLRPFTLADAREHLEGEDGEIARWTGGRSTLESVQRWIERNRLSWEDGGPVYNFAIVAPGDHLAGMVEANTDYAAVTGIGEGDANISYSVYPTFRGEGYAPRAVNLVCELLKARGVRRAVIRVHPGNASSLRVPAKCGFAATGAVDAHDGPLLVFARSL